MLKGGHRDKANIGLCRFCNKEADSLAKAGAGGHISAVFFRGQWDAAVQAVSLVARYIAWMLSWLASYRAVLNECETIAVLDLVHGISVFQFGV